MIKVFKTEKFIKKTGLILSIFFSQNFFAETSSHNSEISDARTLLANAVQGLMSEETFFKSVLDLAIVVELKDVNSGLVDPRNASSEFRRSEIPDFLANCCLRVYKGAVDKYLKFTDLEIAQMSTVLRRIGMLWPSEHEKQKTNILKWARAIELRKTVEELPANEVLISVPVTTLAVTPKEDGFDDESEETDSSVDSRSANKVQDSGALFFQPIGVLKRPSKQKYCSSCEKRLDLQQCVEEDSSGSKQKPRKPSARGPKQENAAWSAQKPASSVNESFSYGVTNPEQITQQPHIISRIDKKKKTSSAPAVVVDTQALSSVRKGSSSVSVTANQNGINQSR